MESPSPIQDKVFRLKIEALNLGFKQTALSSFVLPLFTYIAFMSNEVLIWLGCYYINSAFWLSNNYRTKKKYNKDDVETHHNCLKAWKYQTFSFAFFWTLIPWFIDFQNGTQTGVAFMVLSGVTSGTTIIFAPFPKIAKVYFLTILSSLMISLFSQDFTRGILALEIMTATYIVFLIRLQSSLKMVSEQTIQTIVNLDKANALVNKYKEASISSSIWHAQAEMSARLAHEINNPLAIVLMKVQVISKLLSKPNPDIEKVQKNCASATNSCERIANIVKSTKRVLYNPPSGNQDTLTNVELSDLLSEIEEIYTEKCQSRLIDFHIQAGDKLLVFGNETYLMQIITNLIENSIDAVVDKKERSINVFVKADHDSVSIFVKDTGDPIDDEIADKMFDPYFTTKGKGIGLGVGLNLCTELAQQMKGQLKLFSKVPTTFQLQVPRPPADEALAKKIG